MTLFNLSTDFIYSLEWITFVLKEIGSLPNDLDLDIKKSIDYKALFSIALQSI